MVFSVELEDVRHKLSFAPGFPDFLDGVRDLVWLETLLAVDTVKAFHHIQWDEHLAFHEDVLSMEARTRVPEESNS